MNFAFRTAAGVLCTALITLVTPSSEILAQSTSGIHVVRNSETLASIAQLYYADPRRENVLVAENGLTSQGGAAIEVGMRLIIPAVTYHLVQPGEGWQGLATRFYGRASRAYVLVEANRGSLSVPPNPGAEILIPYPLRHVAEQGDTMSELASLYYGDSERARQLRRFNDVRTNGLTRGQMILVPLAGLLLSPQGRRIFEESLGGSLGDGSVRDVQSRIDSEIPVLRAHISAGRFLEALTLGNQLLGIGTLTESQSTEIHRELAIVYVAMDREDLAISAFRAALNGQRDMVLDSNRTSPRVLRAFRLAREQLNRQWRPEEESTENATDSNE